MDDKVKGLREALVDFLRVGSCRSRSGPVAMTAESCGDNQCVGCRGRLALREYERGEVDRFREKLSMRAILDTSEEMAACLGFYERALAVVRSDAPARFTNPRSALAEVRALCNGALDTNKYGDRPLDDVSVCLVARIEWVCRHALEDYTRPVEEELSAFESLLKDGGDKARDVLTAHEQAKKLAGGEKP